MSYRMMVQRVSPRIFLIGHMLINPDIVMQFTSAEIERLESLFGNSPLLQAIKASRQWRWERANDATSLQSRGQTNCMIALIPGSEMEDFSYVIRVGYKAGRKITEYLQYGESSNQALNSM